MFKNNLSTYTMNKTSKKISWKKRLSIIYHKLIDNKIKVTWLDLIKKDSRQKYIKIYNKILIKEFYNIAKKIKPKIKQTKKELKKELETLIIFDVLNDDITYK